MTAIENPSFNEKTCPIKNLDFNFKNSCKIIPTIFTENSGIFTIKNNNNDEIPPPPLSLIPELLDNNITNGIPITLEDIEEVWKNKILGLPISNTLKEFAEIIIWYTEIPHLIIDVLLEKEVSELTLEQHSLISRYRFEGGEDIPHYVLTRYSNGFIILYKNDIMYKPIKHDDDSYTLEPYAVYVSDFEQPFNIVWESDGSAFVFINGFGESYEVHFNKYQNKYTLSPGCMEMFL
jgi:hypothetical protein